MGFNISGLVINKSYKDNFDELQSELGWNLKKQEDITFETASSNYKDDNICDVYFSEKGTLLFISINRLAESWKLKDANTLNFALSDISTTFHMSYCEKGIEKRAILEADYHIIKEEGEKLNIEDKSSDTSEIIFNQMEVVLGKSFWKIVMSEKAERYIFE